MNKTYMPTPPTLKNYVARYITDKRLLKEHPEHKDLLEKRIKRHEQDIIAYVTSDNFQHILDKYNF